MPVKQWLEWLFSEDRRQAKRHTSLPLVAYYWDGAEPVAHGVLDASMTGLYVLTQQRWYPGTVVTMTLQRAHAGATDPERSIAVNAKVVRSGKDGVGLAFMPTPASDPRQSTEGPVSAVKAADGKTIDKFFRRLQADTAQALVEFALVLPLILLLVVNAVNFGGFFYSWIAVSNAVRAGADYAIMGGSSAGAPSTATGSQIQAVVTQDLASLPNQGSLVVNICQNDNSGTIVTLAGTCSSATTPTDPEASSYILTRVDVSYTYVPIISTFSFPRLAVHLTLPPTTVHLAAEMRAE